MTAPAQQQSGLALLELAAAARAVQLMIRTALLRDVTRLWPALDPARLNATFPGWLRAMSTLITGYHRQSATAAGRYYQLARASAIQTPTPTSLIRLAPAPNGEWLTKALGYAGPGMLTRDETRPGTALSTTLGTANRIALDGGRTTVLDTLKADPVAVGWYRVTDGQPCAWCALLASRGVTYKSAKSAGDGQQWHNDCGCSVAPAFTRDQPLPAVSEKAARVYRERGNGDALVAFRKAWSEHQAATMDVKTPATASTVPGRGQPG